MVPLQRAWLHDNRHADPSQLQLWLHSERLLCRPQVRYHEGTFTDLRAAGAPAEGPAYADAGGCGAVGQRTGGWQWRAL